MVITNLGKDPKQWSNINMWISLTVDFNIFKDH